MSVITYFLICISDMASSWQKLLFMTAVGISVSCDVTKDLHTVLLLSFPPSSSGKLINGSQFPDQSDGGHFGTLVGGAAYVKDKSTGLVGLRLAENDYIKYSSPALTKSISTSFSIEVIVKANNTNTNWLVRKLGSFAFPGFVSSDVLRASITTNVSERTVDIFDQGLRISDSNSLQHFGLTYDGKKTSVYVNGSIWKEKSYESVGEIVSAAGELRIGRNFPDTEYGSNFAGIIYMVKISSKSRGCVDMQIGSCIGNTPFYPKG